MVAGERKRQRSRQRQLVGERRETETTKRGGETEVEITLDGDRKVRYEANELSQPRLCNREPAETARNFS